MNCGPRKRFVVMDQHGQPLIVHNCENIVQATANDLLRAALRRMDAEGIEVVLHVHDEIVCETDQPENVLDLMRRVMTTPPAWAAGLPLAAEAQIMSRYGKG